MNIVLTRVIEDLPPRREFTVEDVRRMVEIGVLAEDERLS